jgi:hypothetical protein
MVLPMTVAVGTVGDLNTSATAYPKGQLRRANPLSLAELSRPE